MKGLSDTEAKLIADLRSIKSEPITDVPGLDHETLRRIVYLQTIREYLEAAFPSTLLESLNGPAGRMIDDLVHQMQRDIHPSKGAPHKHPSEANDRATILACVAILIEHGTTVAEARVSVATTLTNEGRATSARQLSDYDEWIDRQPGPDAHDQGKVSPIANKNMVLQGLRVGIASGQTPAIAVAKVLAAMVARGASDA